MDARAFIGYIAAGGGGLNSQVRELLAQGGRGIADLHNVTQRFWLAVPLKIFEPGEPRLKAWAARMSYDLTGEDAAEDVMRVESILCRLRRYVLFGRRRMRPSRLQRVLGQQAGRCACCGYAFHEADISASEYEGEADAEAQIGGLRPPQVDHIIPVFVGPEHADNLQVLCRPCNLAKGACLAWPLRGTYFEAVRPSVLTDPSETVLWMSRARDGKCKKCGVGPLQLGGDEERLEVRRRRESAGWLLENLETVCSSCLPQRV